ncbi:MAG: hypothetical protein KF757_00665 [Phycisphaeraceae bacterium]|nr:hypothetical protein [Phycisphaeraceae bacterium]MCW5761720.1 hypothetical protein [Phycisphaeraceae bacterium]
MAAQDLDLFGRPPAGRQTWDHRRGEPRTFALAWTVFLMVSTLIMFASLGPARIVTEDIYQPAVRILIVSVTVGMVILWPMVRLCQERPRGSICSHIAHDLFIVVLPVQALIWPQTLRMLAQWTVEQASAVSLCQAAWTTVVGAALCFAYLLESPRSQIDLRRAGWMITILGLFIGLPLVLFASGMIDIGPASGTGWAIMVSPITAVHELSREHPPSGVLVIRATHWLSIAVTALVGACAWMAALGIEVARSGRKA